MGLGDDIMDLMYDYLDSLISCNLMFQVNFTTWVRESVFSHFPCLVSLDFLCFVTAITIAGEVTGNRLTGLDNIGMEPHQQGRRKDALATQTHKKLAIHDITTEV